MVKFQKERLDEKCTVAYKSDVDKLVVKVYICKQNRCRRT